MSQSNTTNLIMFIIVLGQHVSIFKHFKWWSVFLEGPEDDSIKIETCCPSTIINIIKCVWLTHYCIFIYVLNTSGWQTWNQFCECDWGFILSKKYPKNLRVRNESWICKKFISGKVPCEVNVVVKYTASVKQCGAQLKSTLHLENNQNTKKSYLHSRAKCRSSGSVLLRANSVQHLRICAEVKLLFEWPVYFFFQSLSWLVQIVKMQNVIPTPITPPSTKLQNNNNNNCCISVVSTETSTTTSSFINYNTPSPTSSHQQQQL